MVAHEVAEKGYVPVFVDGTGIEVDGRLFEHVARLYTGERGYWLHGIFVGGLWASGRLRPGGDVACGWKGQMKRDLAPLLAPGVPVWVHCDSAYYRGGFVEYVSSRGWDYSVSVTDANKCRPVLDVVEDLPEHGWTDIGMGESATPGALPAGEVGGRAELRRGAPHGGAPGRAAPPVHGDPGEPGRPAPSGGGAPASQQAGACPAGRFENTFKGPLVDLDLHYPPRRGYRANQAFYAYGRMAHLLLRAVQPSAAEGRSAARHPAAGAARDAHRRPSRDQRAPVQPAVRLVLLPP